MGEPTVDSDEAIIWKLHQGFLAANRIDDVQFLRQHMASGPDALLWYNLNQSNYVGIDHIARLWDLVGAALRLRGKVAVMDPVDERVTVGTDMALVTYLLNVDIDIGELGHWVLQARDTEVWQKIKGEWKMIHFHCSTHVPGIMGGD